MGHRKKRLKPKRGKPAIPKTDTPAHSPQPETVPFNSTPDQSMNFAGVQMSQYGRFLLHQNVRSEDEQRQFSVLVAEHRKTLPNLIRAEAQEVEALLSKHNSFDILALLSFTQLANDPETYKEWEQEGRAAFAEYAALLCLKNPYQEGQKGELIDGSVITDIIEKIKGIFDKALWYYATEAAHKDKSSGGTEDELRYLSITDSMLVRNHTYAHHLKELLQGLFSDFDPWMTQTFGFHLADLFVVAETIQTLGMDRLYERKKQALALESQLTAAATQARGNLPPNAGNLDPLVTDLLSSPPEEAASRIRTICVGMMFLSLGTTFSYAEDELSTAAGIPKERVGAVLRTFSLGFGQVDREVYMPPAYHDLMLRPFIHHDGRYLAPVPDLLPALQPRLEQLLNPDNPRTANCDRSLWERYKRTRARYAERKTLNLFQQIMPRARAFSNVKYWVEEGGIRKEVELDGLIVFDTTVMLVETKAGSVHEATRRGGFKKIEHDIDKLLVESHAQAARAQHYIDNCNTPIFTLTDGATFALDKSSMKRIFRITVTLDHIDAFTAALHRTAELGLFPDNSLPWAVGIRDLMVIAEMFDFPSQFVHYLSRRKRLNEIGRIYANDELDWLGHYFTEGLYFERLAETHGVLRLLSYTTQFDDYYFYKLGIRQTPAPKPGWRLPPALHKMIQELEETAAPGYSEAVFILLDMSGEAHNQFVSYFDEVRRRTRRDGRCHDASMMSGTKVGLTMFSSKRGTCDADFARLQRFVAWKREKQGTDSWLGLHTVVGERRSIHGWVLI